MSEQAELCGGMWWVNGQAVSTFRIQHAHVMIILITQGRSGKRELVVLEVLAEPLPTKAH